MSDHPTPRPPRRTKGRALETSAFSTELLRETAVSVLGQISEGAKRSLDRFFEAEAAEIHSTLLTSGLRLYHEGEKYTRETDRLVIGAYLMVIATKLSDPGAPRGMPSVSVAEITGALRIARCDATEQEAADLCRHLGLSLSDVPA